MEELALKENQAIPGKSQPLCREVIVILDKASLETVKTKKGDFQLLNCDDHIGIMKKHNKDPAQYRPDIAHQVVFFQFLNINNYINNNFEMNLGNYGFT